MKRLKQTMKRIVTFGLTAALLVNTVPLEAFAADPAGAGGDVSIEAEVAGAGGDVSIEAEASYPAFVQSETVDGVKITIGAEEGVFPEGTVLSAEKVTKTRKEEALEAVEEERPVEQNVAASYTFDIKVLDRDGNEIQPADESRVKLSFKLEEVADSNLETNIYHIRETDLDGTASGEKAGGDRNYSEETTESNDTASRSEESDNKELIAEKLEVETEGDTATAETDGFSLYTVEFSYNDLQYVMPGDSELALSEILNKVSLTGEVTNVEVSSPELFSAGKSDSGEWIVTAHRAFSSEEWMKVTINDIEYKITVTDDSDTMSRTELQDLIIAASDGSTVKLEKDVVWTDTEQEDGSLVVPSGKNVTLDLNNHYILYKGTGSAPVITVNGGLTLKDSKTPKTTRYVTLADGRATGVSESNTSGAIEVTGGFIAGGNNESDRGGGVYVQDSCMFTMEGGTIAGCKALYGGGVNVNNSGKFTMEGGTIAGCKALYAGGGVFVNNSGNFYMNGGGITNCTATGSGDNGGGGVYVSISGKFNMEGGSITNCTATSQGGGVYVKGGTFKVSGSPVISGNKKGDKTNNVTLNYNKTITVTGALTDGAEIRVEAAKDAVIAKPGTPSGSTTEYTITAADAAKFHSDLGDFTGAVDGGNVVLKATLPTATLSPATMEYNGSAFSPTISFEGATLTKDSDYTLSYKMVVDTQETALSSAPKDAGSYKLVVTGKGGYAGTRKLAFTITQKAVTVSGITVKDKIYDGSTTAELITTGAVFEGKCDGDTLTVSDAGAGTFADENAGEGKTVNIDATKFVLGGASSGNYVLAESDQQSTAYAKIKRRPVTITAEDQDMAEGGSIVSNTIFAEITPGEGLTTALVSDHALSSINLTHTLDASHNNMTGTITAAQASIVGAGNTDVSGNYDITYVNGTCKVIPTAVDSHDVTLTDTTLTIAENKTRDFQKYIVVRKGTKPLPDLMDSAWKAGTGSNGGGLVFTGLTRATEYDIYTCTAYGMVSAVTTVKTDKSDTVIDPVPAERTLTYNGEVYALVTESSANGGTLQYALGKDAVNVPASGWSESVPVARNAGTYYVWYKVDGGAAYKDVLPVCVTVTIAKADQTLDPNVLPEESEPSYAVKVALPAGDNSSDYEYFIVEGDDKPLPAAPSWKQLPAIRDGQFIPENPSQDQKSLAPATSYKIWLRLKEDSNHNASAPLSRSFTTPAQVMLSYDANGGSGKLPEAKLYDYGATTDPVAAGTGISRYGYTFNGWKTSADGNGVSYVAGSSFQINQPTVLYAQWRANPYTVSFNANGGTGTIEAEVFTFDTAKALPPIYDNENHVERIRNVDHIFLGWALEANGEVVYKDGQSVKNLVPDGEVTLYAIWGAGDYQISGYVKTADNHSARGARVTLMRGNVTYGSAVTASDGSYELHGVPAGTYNLTVEYDVEGTENDRKISALVEVKEVNGDRKVDTILLPAERVNSAVSVKDNTPAVLVGDLDEVAKDEKEEGKEVTVTMTVETKAETQAEGADAIRALAESSSAASVDVELDYLDIKIEKKVDNAAATNISETGHVIEMIVPFNFANRKNCELYRYHGGVAERFTALAARPEGTFRDACFYADRAHSRIYIYGSRFSTYAISYETGSKVTVTFRGNDGTEAQTSQEMDLGTATSLSANSFTRSGYSFLKWNTEANGGGMDYSDGQSVTLYNDLVLYAQWKQNSGGGGGNPTPASFTVRFDLGGHGTAITPQTVEKGKTATKPADPEAEGFVFTGWYTSSACLESELFDFATPITKDITLYAGWKEAKKFSVSFNMNGKEATDVPETQQIEEGKCATEPAVSPKAEGFKFAGWYKEAACETPFDFGSPITADITLYAGWKADEPVVIEEAAEWNLYEDASVHEYRIQGVSANVIAENSNADSKEYFDAKLSGSTITVKVTGDRKKAASNATLEFDLGKDGVIEYVLPVSYVKPSFKLSANTATIKKDTETVLKTTLLVKNADGSYEPYDMRDVSVSGNGLGTVTKAADGSIEIRTSSAGKGKISIVKESWDGATPVSLAYTVKASKKDVLSVDLGGLKTVVVNSNAKGQSFSFDVTLNGTVPAEGAVTITDKKNSGLASISAEGKLVIAYKEGVKNGTYTITLQAGEAKTNVKIKVSSKALDKALTAKVLRKYDVVTKESMIVAPKQKDLNGTIEAVSVSENGFSAKLNAAGNIVIDYSGTAYDAKNLNIGTLTLTLTIRGVEEPVKLTLNKVKAKKTTPKAKAETVTVSLNAAETEGGVIGTAKIESTYKTASGSIRSISPVKVEIVGTPKGVEAKVNESDFSRIDILSISKKSVSFKVKLTYPGGVTKTVTVKVKKK